ncbi:MAG TPA: hypothetical protein VFE20_04985 [Thermoleophilia bacterium]|nr:hypothetical protein [Thermoleophilia bacterium]
MADLVLGIGTSHGPMLKTPPEQWGDRAIADRQNKRLVYEGREFDFEGLLRARSDLEEIRAQLGIDAWRKQYGRCRRALDVLGERFRAADVDAAIIVSSDHKEVFGDELLPSIAIYWGDSVEHVPLTQAQLDAKPPGLAIAAAGDTPREQVTQPCEPDLARHLISAAISDGFDVAASERLPAGRDDNHGIPHGWGFVYRQIMCDDVVPNVPVFLNTFYPPNQPPVQRCYDFGLMLGRAIQSWEGGKRVAVLASGGLSHFVIEEALDRQLLRAMQERDTQALRGFSDERLCSGSSELRSWISLAAAVSTTELQMEIVDYVPCYRSEAGTGNAMGFAIWT